RRLGGRPARPRPAAGDAGRRDAARDGVPRRREHRDACHDRQLQGRPGASARHHAEAPAMNTTSAVSVAFDPLLPWWLLAVLGGVGLLLVLLSLRARARGTIWRFASVVVVLSALSNPALVEEQRKPIADVALVVVDDSDSMAIGDRRAQVQAAREMLKKKLGQQEGLEVREAVLPPSHIQLGSERPGGTRLIEAMRSALVEVPPER